jgi:hypothetical protein
MFSSMGILITTPKQRSSGVKPKCSFHATTNTCKETMVSEGQVSSCMLRFGMQNIKGLEERKIYNDCEHHSAPLNHVDK